MATSMIEQVYGFGVKKRTAPGGGGGSRLRPELNLARMLCDLAERRSNTDSLCAIHELQVSAGVRDPNPARPVIPFVDLVRGLDVNTSGDNGGDLVGSEMRAPEYLLRGYSVLARAGCTILPNLTGNAAVPIVKDDVSTEWLSTESDAPTPSAPAFRQATLVPKTVSAYTEISRQLSRQANAEFFVRRILLSAIGVALDAAILGGAGGEQPRGILGSDDIDVQAAGSISNSTISAMKSACASSGCDDSKIVFLADPTLRQTLEGRERGFGSGFIWDGDEVGSRAALVSTAAPAGTLIAGDFENVIIGLFGVGIELVVNPFAVFKNGIIAVRAMLSVDLALIHPAAFSVAEETGS
jgi:Phage capsid family